MNKPSRIGAAILGLAGIVATAAGCSADTKAKVEPLLTTGVVKDERWSATKQGYRGEHRFDLDLGTVVYDVTVDEPMKGPRAIFGNGSVVCIPINSDIVERGNYTAGEIAKTMNPPHPAYVNTRVRASDVKVIVPKT